MNPLRRAAALCLICVTVLATGCATSRGMMTLDVPEATSAPAAAAERLVVIETVEDRRVFETAPRNPSTPSLKKGTEYALDATQRKQAIARKRNGYGKALGDILLEGDQTVETLTAELLATGLQQRGYRIVDAAQADGDTLRLQVVIDKFWAWLTPGFWTVAMEAQIHTTLQASTAAGEQRIDVQAYGINRAGTGKEDNWRIAYDRAFVDYATRLQAALDGAGL